MFSARSHPLSELPDGSLVYGVREGGTITFLKNGKVAVGVGGLTYFRQRKRALSRSTLDPNLVNWLEDMLFGQPDNSLGAKILECLVDIPDHVEREKALEVLSRALQALGTLRSGRYTTPVGGKFIDAICELASDLERPPTKMELTHFLMWEPADTSRQCKFHGFEWLPTNPPSRTENSGRYRQWRKFFESMSGKLKRRAVSR